MDIPDAVDDRPSAPSDRMHLLLAERGVALLPEAGNADGRVTLTDAMLAVAVLAASFAMARSSVALGLAALAVVPSALARTHVVMARRRGVGASPGAGGWSIAFLSSAIRVGLILGFISVILATSLVVGGSLGFQVADAYAIPGAILGFVLLAIPLTLLALGYLVPRLLRVREEG